MKKTLIFASMFVAALTLASCSCQNNAGKKGEAAKAAEASAAPEYTVVEKPQVDLSTLEKDADGYYIIFNGKAFAANTVLQDLHLIDITPTIGDLLGLHPLPEWEGKSVLSANR